MIAAIPSQQFGSTTHRFVSYKPRDALEDLGDLSPDQIDEVLRLVPESGAETYLDDPFKAKPNLKSEQTRFSDGTIRVFYSAIESATVQEEVRYWYAKPLLSGHSPRVVFYQLLTCQFDGRVTDLRPHLGSMPYLTADDGYEECNKIGREVVSIKLAGLLTPSARKTTGTCLPVFRRESLSSANLGHWLIFRYDPTSGEVSVEMAPTS